MKIKKVITVTYEELLGLGEEYVQHLQPNQPVRISTVMLSFLCRIQM